MQEVKIRERRTAGGVLVCGLDYEFNEITGLIRLFRYSRGQTMGKYTDIAERVRKQEQAENTIDVHVIAEVIWETDRAIVFRDENGKLWRRVHAYGMTWPMEIIG